MASEISFSKGSAQYNFVENDLKTAAANPNIKWIIVGGKISNANVDKNMYEVKGTMNYDYLCGQNNNLNYQISITGNCGGNGSIRFESSREISGQTLTGNVTC